MSAEAKYRRWLIGICLLALLCLAAGLRLYRLDSLPAGLHYDEAANGELALTVLGGARVVYFSAYAGKEAGYIYLVAIAIKLLGPSILALRLPAALAGVALVGAVFLAARRLVNPSAALLAAGATAGASWLIHVNRIGFRANLLPLCLALWVWLMLRALDHNRDRDWLLSGLMLGLTGYTYLSARAVPMLVLIYLIYIAIHHRDLFLRCRRGILVMLTAAALLATPLGIHFVRVPGDWGERTSQIMLCDGVPAGGCAERVASNIWDALLMIGIKGDPVGFFNLPGLAAIPAGLGTPFYLGVLLALLRWRQRHMMLLLCWWGVMILPGALSSGSPNSLRTIGAAPATMILWALPWAELSRILPERRPYLRHGLATAGAAAVLLIAGLSAQSYFADWARRPYVYYDYMQYAMDAANAVAALPPEADIYVSEQYYKHPSYLFLTPRLRQARWFDARIGWPLARPGRRTIYVIPPTTPVNLAARPFFLGASGRNAIGVAGMYAYTLLELASGQAAEPKPAIPLGAAFGPLSIDGLTIGELRLGQPLHVTLFCHATAATRQELRVFMHLIDAQGHMVAQQDLLSYASLDWRPGDRFVNFHTLALPAQLPSGQYRLVIGLYDTGTLLRLAAAGQASDSVMLPLQVH